MSESLIQALQNPQVFAHATSGFEVIQTHLSWVILTGKYAYKIKKPLNLGFQDYTTLEKRKYYCELELALNKRLAPQIYLEVVKITGSIQNPHLDGTQEPIEYALKMNQFSQQDLLNNLVTKGKITATIIEDITKKLASFHQDAPIDIDNSAFGTPSVVFAPIQDNFQALKQLPASQPFLEEIKLIENWASERYLSLKTLLSERKKSGFIRRCHGDLHLGNIVMIANEPVIFDCIEFNESFIWTDVMNDVGFLAMDLDHHQLRQLKQLFINNYTEITNDYLGMKLLTFYQSYRAMVRAKVSALQLNQLEQASELKTKLNKDLEAFLHLAKGYTQTISPKLFMTYGTSGSGKTLYSEKLLKEIDGAIRLRSDVIRKQLFSLAPNEPSAPHHHEKLYSQETTQTVYHKLVDIAKALLSHDHTVIIDATCLKAWQRELFIDLAKTLNVPWEILAFKAEPEILKQRIQLRLMHHKDASDASIEILNKQLSTLEPLSEFENAKATWISSGEVDALIELKGKNHA